MPQLLQAARVPFATRGAEMTGMGRTAQAWNCFKMMKWRSVFLWDQTTSENTNSSLFPPEVWSVPLFFTLLFSCLETKTYLYYYPRVFHLTKRHQAVCSKFLKWRGQNASLPIPPDCEIQSTTTCPVPFWTCSPSCSKSGPLSSSRVSWAEQYFWQWWAPQSYHPSWQIAGAILTFHKMVKGSGKGPPEEWGRSQGCSDDDGCWAPLVPDSVSRHLSARPMEPHLLDFALSKYIQHKCTLLDLNRTFFQRQTSPLFSHCSLLINSSNSLITKAGDAWCGSITAAAFSVLPHSSMPPSCTSL